MKMRIYIALGAVVWLAGCGTPGAPRPPSLRLPRTVGDLAATRVGSTVTLTWTEPHRTTDGETVRALGPTLVCMGVNDFPMTHCDEAVADLSQPQYASCAPKVGQAVTCAVTLPAQVQEQNPIGQATYAIEVLNTNGRSAGLSNQVRVPTAPAVPMGSGALAAPSAAVTANAVELRWMLPELLPDQANLRFEARVFRRVEGSTAEIEIGAAHPTAQKGAGVEFAFADRSFAWEQTYSYLFAVTTLVQTTGEEVSGKPSPEVKVVTHDTFAPAASSGLQAVASGVGQPAFVDLSWAPNTESDLAGYNVYRHEEGQAPVKINSELVKAPAYRDKDVQRGHKYFYAVSAVDLRGNESGKSGEASETVQ